MSLMQTVTTTDRSSAMLSMTRRKVKMKKEKEMKTERMMVRVKRLRQKMGSSISNKITWALPKTLPKSPSTASSALMKRRNSKRRLCFTIILW